LARFVGMVRPREIRPGDRRHVRQAWHDGARRALGECLQALGYGAIEAPWREEARWPGVRLRGYGDATAARAGALIVPAPIKRAYIWDIEPRHSAVRALLDSGLAVYLIEWTDDFEGGLAEAGNLLDRSLTSVLARTGEPVVLLGHSLGGTLASLLAAMQPDAIAGLALLEAPLHFGMAAGAFAPLTLGAPDMPRLAIDELRPVPGTVLDWFSIIADPISYAFLPALDAVTSAADAELFTMHMRVRRWTFDEFAMPARLFRDVVVDLYRDDRFYRGALAMGRRHLSPADMTMPILAVVNPFNPDVPPLSTLAFLKRTHASSCSVTEYGGERGIALQHVGILVGRRAHAVIWPRITGWIRKRLASGRRRPRRSQ
jgi:polyhydroxyalkanoate synthase subunit PhaC